LTARLQLHTPAGRAMPRGGPDERRQEVLSAMKSPSAAATRTLIGALGDADPLVREWAIEALSRRKDRSAAVKELLERLQDDRADVRWYAARALGKLGGADDAVRRALTDALTDPDEYVRCFAAWALGVLHLKDAIPALRQRLLRDDRRRRGLEDQAIGVALARLNTDVRPTPEEQRALFGEDVLAAPTLPDQLPRTKGELLREELLKTAETILVDRAGGAVVVRGTMRLSMQYARSLSLKERVLIERGRRCQLCGFTFKKIDGDDYAECHHLEPVSQGGPDHADNLLVVCPNHHKQLHLAAVTFPGGKSRPETVRINGETITIGWGQ